MSETGRVEYSVERRYSDFVTLSTALRGDLPGGFLLQFCPPKSMVNILFMIRYLHSNFTGEVSEHNELGKGKSGSR